MSDKEDLRLVRQVSGAVSRLLAELAGPPEHVAAMSDPKICNATSFRASAYGHVEILEREAKNIMSAVAQHHKATNGQEGDDSTQPTGSSQHHESTPKSE